MYRVVLGCSIGFFISLLISALTHSAYDYYTYLADVNGGGYGFTRLFWLQVYFVVIPLVASGGAVGWAWDMVLRKKQ